MRIKVTLEIELEEGYLLNKDDEQKLLFENEIMVGDGTLTLHSSDIGDTVGVVKKIENLKYL